MIGRVGLILLIGLVFVTVMSFLIFMYIRAEQEHEQKKELEKTQWQLERERKDYENVWDDEQ